MKFDLHVHSAYSNDSNARVIEIIEQAVARGLDGIAITDHHSFWGSKEACEINPYPHFLIIPGTEYATEYGHVQGLFIQDALDLDENLRSKSGIWPFQMVVEAIHRRGGIAVLAHPFKRKTVLPDEVWPLIDAIEVYNSRATHGGKNRRANAQAWEAARKYKLPFTAGSDAHLPGEIGRAYLELDLDDKQPEGISLEAVKKAILAGKGKICGRGTPPYYQGLSQLVKVQKTHDYKRLPKILAKTGIATLAYLFSKARRGENGVDETRQES